MIYNFQISDRQISADNTVLVADNTTDVASFTFDDEWEGLVRTVRFQQGSGYTDIVLINDRCTIPRLTAGTLYIGVFAGDLHTSAPCSLTVGQSILSCGGSPEAPSEDVYAQLMGYISENCTEHETASASESVRIVTEAFTVPANTWNIGMMSPFVKMHDMTVTSEIGENSIVSLGDISAETQATYGIVIGGVYGQTVRLYCMTEPDIVITGRIIIMG